MHSSEPVREAEPDWEQQAARKKRVDRGLAAVEEKVGRSVHALLEEKCSQLSQELEHADFQKQQAQFALEKANLELRALRDVRDRSHSLSAKQKPDRGQRTTSGSTGGR